ncbi:response regulator [Ramlibacter sp. PS3R-8]|uniref:response regulator n=1 Tax=Ramlibacter sp. PS3R-8 TaxID=3133437 RepID=UPI00309BD47A
MTAPAFSAPAFDRARLEDVANGNPVVAAEFLAEFRRTTDRDTAMLLSAATAREPAQVIESAHRIEGACRMIGAAELAGACSGIAKAVSSGNAAALRTALAVFTQSRHRLHAFMDAPEAGKPPPAGGSEGGLLCSGLAFLVVEDHEFQRGVIIRTLQRLGAARVHGFAEGAGALEAARILPRSGAILMLDLGMPTLNGSDIARIAGEEQLAVSVILLSAQPDDVLLSQVEQARSGGVEVLGAIGKPLTAIKLTPLIARHRDRVARSAAGLADPR